MADVEINSFVEKFKLLRGAGFEASLSFECKLGEVCISLNCKVGRVAPPTSPSQSFFTKRSPSYYRRLERRKAERESCNGLPENCSLKAEADKAKVDPSDEVIEDAVCTDNATGCSSSVAGSATQDEIYRKEKESAAVAAVSQEELEEIERREREVIEKDEAAKDRIIDRIIVSSVTMPIEEKIKVEEEIKVKLGNLGVMVKSMMATDRCEKFEMSLVDTTPVNLNKIWGRRLGLDNCSIIAYEKPPWKK